MDNFYKKTKYNKSMFHLIRTLSTEYKKRK